MLNIQEIFSFVAVVKTGSFTKASKSTGLPKSTLSRHVQTLEERLALTLFQRTTRRLELTKAGEDFFNQSRNLVTEFENLEHHFRSQSAKVEGTIRITCPVEVGVCVLPPILKSFQMKYPRVDFQLALEDETVNLIDSKMDVAIRAGHLQDSSLIARQIGQSQFQLYCSPEYLNKYSELNSPSKIEKAQFIEFSSKPLSKVILMNEKTKKTMDLKAKHCTQSNSLRMSMELAAHGLGVCLLPKFMGDLEVGSGRLSLVLEGWATEPHPLQIVYPAQRQLSLKLRKFIDHMTQGV